MQAQRRFREVDLALLPVGSIEQHGPHLPLDTELLQQSRNVTAYAMTAGRVHNHSLFSTQVAQIVGHVVPHRQLRDIDTVSTELHTQIDGECVLMFRPLLTRPEPGRDTALPEASSPPTLPPPAQAKAALQQSAARRAFDIYAEQEWQVLDNRLKRKRGKVQFRLYYDEPTDHTNLRRGIGGASR